VTWKSYPQYKDSGIPWVGQIPEHWEVKSIKYLTLIQRGKFTHRPRNDPKLYNGQYPFIQTGDITSSKKWIKKYNQTLNESGLSVSKIFPKGTLIMSIAANIGDLAILDFDSCFPDSIVGFTPLEGVFLDFFYYQLTAQREEMLNLSTMNTQLNINVDRIGTMKALFPPNQEQVRIAQFLDQKTASIDGLIQKKQKQIELLKEKRAALISHVVTKGLDPNVKMKNSGIPWLGQIPEHWRVKKNGLIANVIDPQPDHRAPKLAEGEGFPYIGIRDVNSDGTLNIETARQIEEKALVKQENSFCIDDGDIVFCKVGTLGLPRQIKPHCRVALSATLVLIKVQKVISNFLLFALDAHSVNEQIKLASTGSTRAALGIEQIRKFKIVLPPLEEQRSIIKFLDRNTKKIDNLIKKIEKSIDLLKEFRSALISAAVTGKIDVREN
jgi:type I restriction enzyme S subunit